MQFLSPIIDRIIIHQIYKKDKDKQTKKLPFQNTDFTNFEASALDNFRSRYDEAIGGNSKAVEMLIDTNDPNHLINIVKKSITDTDSDFINSSFEITKKLDRAQKKASESGGIIVIFTGKCNYPRRDFLGIIKAEIHSGYEKIEDPLTKEISLKFLQEVLLTPGTKLYKSAAFLKKPNYNEKEMDPNKNWEVWVSDQQVSGANGKVSSDYFLKDFLGFVYPDTAARKTMQFYNQGMNFIKSANIDNEKRNDYLNALTTYLKVDQSNIVSPVDFSEKYLENKDKKEFLDFLDKNEIKRSNFLKDISEIKTKLKYRKLSFKNSISVIGEPEEFKNNVTFTTIEGDPDKNGNIPKWTKIIIKDELKSQE
ncbi:nucleoid-associated protein [Marinomonas posidonica]|uniref:37kDa nucleoid-associated protein n=1 Tax=Marinomonas posidonica (strain CECT 7376 / NCIMB 14433 / IVIA-Po-181) TaxID=491952 RepID=F6CYH3_MARPP|nr:nucleoid-associated protein [Marinomonas posidonica]AEF54582.1 hypothetical protein Mar181_1540 [Marinomonas posidonica IVIA-Po-181]